MLTMIYLVWIALYSRGIIEMKGKVIKKYTLKFGNLKFIKINYKLP